MIGVIGFGRFGQLTTRYLARDFEVRVYNRSDRREAIRQAGAVPADLAEACRQPVVVLCIPISRMREMLTTIAPMLAPGAIVMDVCSVKTLPVQWMEQLLPESVSILATHPMFGPDSAADSLEQRKMVLCPVRIPEDAYSKITAYLKRQGLVLIETTAGNHDRQIAVTLALTHFIGRSLSAFGAGELEIDTEGYKRLRHILGVVENDTWELFEDMHRYNPFATDARDHFLGAMVDIHDRLTGKEDQTPS